MNRFQISEDDVDDFKNLEVRPLAPSSIVVSITNTAVKDKKKVKKDKKLKKSKKEKKSKRSKSPSEGASESAVESKRLVVATKREYEEEVYSGDLTSEHWNS